MRKFLLLAALAAVALTACTSDEYLGRDTDLVVPEKPVPINMGYRTSAMTRATQNMEELGIGTFRLYGTKGASGIQVFNNYLVWHANYNNTEATTRYWDYVGSKDEEVTPYVGPESSMTPTTKVKLPNDQDLKYWDYEQPSYHFWAVAPWDETVSFSVDDTKTVPGTRTDGMLTTATLANVGGHLMPNSGTAQAFNKYYLTNPTTVDRDDYGNDPVVLTFRRTDARVRVGFYETVKGYAVKDMKFWNVRVTQKGNSMKVKGTSSDNVTLNRTDYGFVGNTTASPTTMTVKYDNVNDEYSIGYDQSSVSSSRRFYAGSFAGATISTSSSTPTYGIDSDMDGTNYFSVLPTPTEFGDYGNADPALNGTPRPYYLVCDFTLIALDGSEEEIHVKGARAQVPAEYTTWRPNTAYTYLFKISQKTNGTTGDDDPTVGPGSDPDHPGVDPDDPDHPDPVDPTDPDNPDPSDPDDPGYDPDFPPLPEPDPQDPDSPEGLYVITFDAVVEEVADENLQGTTTTLSTPSITTYQNGVDVEANGIIYKPGVDITISAMYGATPITTGINWVKLPGAFDYGKTYEQNVGDLTYTPGNKITAPTAGTYVIKVSGNINGASFTGYKHVVVGAPDGLTE